MPGEVSNREHLIAQRWNEEEINLREHAGHFFRHFAPEAVGLYKVHRGQKPGLTKNVRPRVWNLSFQLIQPAIEREFLERRRTFSEENQVERVIRPVGNSDLHWNHSQLAHGLQCGAVDIGGGILLHPSGDVAYA